MHGDYPKSMKKAAGKKMASFTWKQSKQLMNSFDFLGVNYYVTMKVEDNPNYVPADQRDFIGDMSASMSGKEHFFKSLFNVIRMLN